MKLLLKLSAVFEGIFGNIQNNMRWPLLTLLLLVLFIVPLAAQERSDVVVMKNGDRLTCEIVSLDGGTLSVKLDYADGTISLQWSKIARLESKRLFIVRTQSGSVYTGTLATTEAAADEPVKIEVARTADTKVELQPKEVVTIGTTAENFWNRLNGEISVGLSYTKGNQSTQYNLNSSAEYLRERWSAKATFTSNLASSSDSEPTTRNQFSFRANRDLRWRKFFYTGALGFLQSSEQGIGFQSNVNGGVGYYVKNTGRLKVSVVGGLGWQRTHYKGNGNSSTTQNIAAAIVSTDIKFLKFKKSRFALDSTLFLSLSEPGRVYFTVNQSYSVKLFSNLSWNVSFFGNLDSRPPLGLSRSDYGTSTGLGWTFGNK